MDTVKPCPNCKGDSLFRGPEVEAGGGHVDLLPGLGGILHFEKLIPVVCRDCGLMRFFARKKARAKLKDAKKWKRISARGLS